MEGDRARLKTVYTVIIMKLSAMTFSAATQSLEEDFPNMKGACFQILEKSTIGQFASQLARS